MSNEIAEIQAFKPELYSIEECLIELEKYGMPRLGKYDSGWICNVKVFVTGKGVNFEVDSGFIKGSPKLAVNECFDLLEKAIKDIKNTK